MIDNNKLTVLLTDNIKKLADDVCGHDRRATPGPWCADVSGNGPGAAVQHSDTVRVVAHPSKHVVGRPAYDSASNGRAKYAANLRLIAFYRTAAPILANFCLRLLEENEDLRKRAGDDTMSGSGESLPGRLE